MIVADLQRHTHVRLSDRADDWSHPVWRDDSTVVYARGDGPRQSIVTRAADGSGGETELGPGTQPSVGGGRLVFSRLTAGAGGDLYHLFLPQGAAQPGPPEPLQRLPVHESEAALSPDEPCWRTRAAPRDSPR